MTVEIWSFERSDYAHEKKALLHLARELNALSEHFVMITNPVLYGQEVDALVIKKHMVFVVEVKSADGPITGNLYGPWTVRRPDGEMSVLNDERDRNPFEQIQQEYRRTLDFINNHIDAMMTPGEAAQNDFRAIKNVLVVDPEYDPEASDIDLGNRDRWLNIVGLHNQVAEPFWRLGNPRRITMTPEQAAKLARDVLRCRRNKDMERLIASTSSQEAEVSAPAQSSESRPAIEEEGAGPADRAVPPAEPRKDQVSEPESKSKAVASEATASDEVGPPGEVDAAEEVAATEEADAAEADVAEVADAAEEADAAEADAAEADAAGPDSPAIAPAEKPLPDPTHDAGREEEAFREAETDEWMPETEEIDVSEPRASQASTPVAAISDVADQVISQVRGTLGQARKYFEVQRTRWHAAHPLEYGDLIYVLHETADKSVHRLPPEVIVPNYYQVALSESEYQRFAQLLNRYERRLADDLKAHVVAQGYVFDEAFDRLVVEIVKDPNLTNRVDVQPEFREVSPTAILTGPDGQTLRLFAGDRVTIGRGDQVDWYVPDFNEHPVASRTHCAVHASDDGSSVVVQDIGSTNGTLIDGERIVRREVDEDALIMLGRNQADDEGPRIHVHLVPQVQEDRS
jgi:hypothetical protein